MIFRVMHTLWQVFQSGKHRGNTTDIYIYIERERKRERRERERERERERDCSRAIHSEAAKGDLRPLGTDFLRSGVSLVFVFCQQNYTNLGQGRK